MENDGRSNYMEIKMKIWERNNCAACLRGWDAELFVNELLCCRVSTCFEARIQTGRVWGSVQDLVPLSAPPAASTHRPHVECSTKSANAQTTKAIRQAFSSRRINCV